MRDNLPNPRPPLQHPPLMDHSFAALGWLHRAAQAVGSPRFGETTERAQFYLQKANYYACTPGERAVVRGMFDSLGELIAAHHEAEKLLAESCLGMNAMECWAFTELNNQQAKNPSAEEPTP